MRMISKIETYQSIGGLCVGEHVLIFVRLLVLAITCYIVWDRSATATYSAAQKLKNNISWDKWIQSAESRQISSTPMSVFNGTYIELKMVTFLLAASYGIWKWKWAIQEPDMSRNMETVGACCRQWQFCDAAVQCSQWRSVLRAAESLRFKSVWTLQHVEW
jgi:hypothetical protein